MANSLLHFCAVEADHDAALGQKRRGPEVSAGIGMGSGESFVVRGAVCLSVYVLDARRGFGGCPAAQRKETTTPSRSWQSY